MPKPTVLIVDDVPANIRMLEAALKPDYDISATTNGAEAIDMALSSEPPDLILLDIVMPDMNGYEVCRRLKEKQASRNIPVIFITARNEEEEETRGFDLGAVDYITKPFSPDIVRSRVGTHLDLKRHRDHLEELNALLKQEIGERRRSERALRHVLKKQEMNIDLAKKMLKLVNGRPRRYSALSRDMILFADVVSVPCYAEGGDHFFVRTMPSADGGAGDKTVISLKDQSGHEVSCVLRSIMTDMLHNRLLCGGRKLAPEDVMSRLNDIICRSEIFEREDFFTGLTAEIDHDTLVMRYVSNGHPPFLLIRNGDIRFLPDPDAPGANIPVAVMDGTAYSAGECRLGEGDKLIFYTDGLTEMPLKNRKKMITSDRLGELVRKAVGDGGAGPPVSDIMHGVLRSASEISRETVVPGAGWKKSENTSADDVTLLCLEIENNADFRKDIWHPRDSDDIARRIIGLCELLGEEWKARGYASPGTRLRMVAEEAILNAWTHGNRQDPDKALTVRWRFGNDFHLEITDQGGGFDFRNIPDPTSDRNLTLPSGRGIFIIRYFSDMLRWEEDGRRLIATLGKRPEASGHSSRTEKIEALWEICGS